jgi:integrase
MPRQANGSVVVRETSRGLTFALRFWALGRRQYVTLGTDAEGWTRQRAEEELRLVIAQVRRGVWRPPAPEPMEESADPTFHEFASQWWLQKRLELKEATIPAYENELVGHLLPFFHRHRLSQITVAEVDRYKAHKLAEPRPELREGRLASETINKHLVRLGQILDIAVEREIIGRNPVKVGKRKLRVARGRPVHLDSAEHIAVLMTAADHLELESSGGRKTPGRRALVATLVFAGLRATELCELEWRDIDLAGGRIQVGHAKTAASYREVDILPVLRDELLAWKASASNTKADALVFPTATGKARDKDNVRNRVVKPIADRADLLLTADGAQPLPRGVTPHKLRHTFASLLIALGRDPAYVMGQLGHTDAKFTLRVYTHVMRRNDDERDRLKALVEGRDWALIGTSQTDEAEQEGSNVVRINEKAPTESGLPWDGSDGTRTRDLRRDRTDPRNTPEGGEGR